MASHPIHPPCPHPGSGQILNIFFSNIVSNLKIAEYVNCDPIADNINDPVIKSSVKYRNRPSILKTGEVCNRKHCFLFSFSNVDKEETLKKNLSLDSTKKVKIQTFQQKLLKIMQLFFQIFFF